MSRRTVPAIARASHASKPELTTRIIPPTIAALVKFPVVAGLLVLVLISVCGLPTKVAAALAPESIFKLAPKEIERALPKEHPSNYYLYASRLWGEGKSDDAAFWLYAGQLRFRFHLLANPNLERSGDPALFGAFQATLGEPINLYVGGDTKKWMEQINRVLAWDEKTPNGFTSKKTHAKQLEEIRAGLMKLRDHIATNQDSIRATREEEGIGAVGVVNGVYVEERKKKMPKDWPALGAATTPAQLAGTYEAGFAAPLGPLFFFSDPSQARNAKSFELSSADPDHLTVVAKNGAEILLERTLSVAQENGAVVFIETKSAAQSGLGEGGTKGIIFLRLNAGGELVIQRDSVIEGKYPNKPTPIRLSHTFWNRAKRLPVPEAPPPARKR